MTGHETNARADIIADARVRIYYEDEHIIVAVKPYGVLSEAHDSLPSLPVMLSRQCNCEIYPVHRLDKTTQGLIVYAKTSASAARLSAAIQNGEVQKTYLALIEGVPDAGGELTDLLYFDRKKGKSYVVKRERKGVKEAKLSYERLETTELGGMTVSKVRVRLLTGRTHQIRVQFASRRMPLVGDRRYGSHVAAGNIALCAAELQLPHPVSGELMRFSWLPDDPQFLVCHSEEGN